MKGIILIIMLTAVVTLVSIETILERPYQHFKNVLKPSRDSSEEMFVYKDTCRVPKISHVPPFSSIIIGHAYGAHRNKNDFLAPDVERFIRCLLYTSPSPRDA